MTNEIKFPRWEGYKDLDGVKQMISYGCYNDPKLVLELAAKISIEREYFKNMLLFFQYRLEKYFSGEGLGLGIDSSREIFEGLIIIPVEEVSFPEEEEENEGIDEDIYEQFVKDMEKAGIEYEEYNGRFFYHGPAVRTNEKGFPKLQDVMRATKVELQWDNLGKIDFIAYPRK